MAYEQPFYAIMQTSLKMVMYPSVCICAPDWKSLAYRNILYCPLLYTNEHSTHMYAFSVYARGIQC